MISLLQLDMKVYHSFVRLEVNTMALVKEIESVDIQGEVLPLETQKQLATLDLQPKKVINVPIDGAKLSNLTLGNEVVNFPQE